VTLIVRGKTSHVARPDTGVDAISAACQAFTAIQQFVARRTNPLERRLIGFGTINGGTRMNVVADEVTLHGTIRTIEPESRKAIIGFLRNDLKKVAGSMGATVQVKIDESYPPLVNDDRVVDAVASVAREMLGPDSLVDIPQPVLGGEDFSYYALGGVPAAMFRIGTLDAKKGFTAAGHNSRFDFDDRRVLPIGAAMLATTAIRLLEG
jgi:amidohydrolase